MILAIVINRKETKAKGFWRFCFVLSIAVPQFVSLLIMRSMLQQTGIVNTLLLKYGIIDTALPFFTNATWARVTVIVINLWVGIPYTLLQVTGILQNIPGELYEAAKIDGATRWQQIKYITLPLLRPTIIMLTMMAIGRIFYSDFGLFYQVPMNQGALYSTTNTIDTYVYRGLLQMGNVSMSAAAGVYQSIVGFILVLGANLLVRKIDRDSALI